jgi:phytoene synthase
MQQHSLKSDLRADTSSCRALLRGGSRTFYAASFLLPRRVREPAAALYAFCRHADDAVDIDGGSLGAIHRLRERLELAYAGRPYASPVDRAFAETVAQFQIPRELPEGLIAGLEWDALGRRYRDLSDLQAYAVRVAGAVGAMMAVLMDVRSPELIARACDLGVAMQLTNIARDVGEDARAGRIYLPMSWLEEAGIDAQSWLARPHFSEQLGAVIARLLDKADEFYAHADAAIAALPTSCRPGIRAARLLYAEIGNELRRENCDSVSRRAFVPARRKLELLASAVMTSDHRSREIPRSCLNEAKFLVDAVVAMPCSTPFASGANWWDLHGQAVRLIEIFDELGRRELSTGNSREHDQATA